MLQRDPRSVSESTKSIHLILPRGIVTEQRRGEHSEEAAKTGTSKVEVVQTWLLTSTVTGVIINNSLILASHFAERRPQPVGSMKYSPGTQHG